MIKSISLEWGTWLSINSRKMNKNTTFGLGIQITRISWSSDNKNCKQEKRILYLQKRKPSHGMVLILYLLFSSEKETLWSSICNIVFSLLLISFPRIATQHRLNLTNILPDIKSFLHGPETTYGKAAKCNGGYLSQFT